MFVAVVLTFAIDPPTFVTFVLFAATVFMFVEFPATVLIFAELEFRRLAENFNKIFHDKIEKVKDPVKEIIVEKKSFTAGHGQFSLFDQEKKNVNENLSKRVSKDQVTHIFQIIDSKVSANLFLDKLMKQSSVAYSLLLDDKNPLESNLSGISSIKYSLFLFLETQYSNGIVKRPESYKCKSTWLSFIKKK